MGTKGVCFAALVALALAAAPARAESEGNGPAGNDGAFTGWVVPVGAASASAAGMNADGYTPSPCFGVALSGPAPAGGAGEAAALARPARSLGGAGAGTTHARASAPDAPRG